MAPDVTAVRADLVETLTAIKTQDAREDDLKVQLRINHTERSRNFRHVTAILDEAKQAGLAPADWQALLEGVRQDVSRALTVASVERM